MDKYYEKEFEIKSVEGVKFKIDKMNPNFHLTLALNVTKANNSKDLEYQNKVNETIFSNIKFCKNADQWNPIMNKNGSFRLAEIEDNPSILLELLAFFQSNAVLPIFSS